MNPNFPFPCLVFVKFGLPTCLIFILLLYDVKIISSKVVTLTSEWVYLISGFNVDIPFACWHVERHCYWYARQATTFNDIAVLWMLWVSCASFINEVPDNSCWGCSELTRVHLIDKYIARLHNWCNNLVWLDVSLDDVLGLESKVEVSC